MVSKKTRMNRVRKERNRMAREAIKQRQYEKLMRRKQEKGMKDTRKIRERNVREYNRKKKYYDVSWLRGD